MPHQHNNKLMLNRNNKKTRLLLQVHQIKQVDCRKIKGINKTFLLESLKGFGRDVVLIDGVRTPFLQSFTSYKDLMGYQLARHALL
jgi:hypothetical protein